MDKIPIILLAAGSSSRMGQPKQLLSWGDQTLIGYQVKKLLGIGNPVYVVLGSSSEQILPLLKKYLITIVNNLDWKNGMGTSVSAGLKQVLMDLPNAKAVICTLIDQPLVTAAHLQKLIDSFTSGQEQIIASRSESGWLGVPALFDRYYFEELSLLNGEQGAKKVIRKYSSKVVPVNAGDLVDDIDTTENYQRILRRYLKG